MDFFTRKLAYVWLRFSEFTVNFIVLIYSIFYKRKDRSGEIKSIGAFWYYPPDLTGSNLRLGGWQEFFSEDRIKFKNYHINNLSDFVKNIEKGNWTQKYCFYSKNLWRRLPQLLDSHKFDTIWIDRSLIPYYPRNHAYLEKRIKKVCKRLIVDSTDGGDYKGNPKLMMDVYKTADEITVGYKYLKHFFDENHLISTQVFWTIPTDKYFKKSIQTKEKLIVGWMGSPGNFSQVLLILDELKEVYKTIPFIFRYICRKNFNTHFEGIDVEYYSFSDDYYKIISSFDIGISPFLDVSFSTQGKIAMKHQEFLLMGIPQICSPVAISEFVVNDKHVLIANNLTDWSRCLIKLMTDVNKQKMLSIESKKLFEEYYTFKSQYPKLKKVLLNLKDEKK
jgi:hypothetical protein